MTPSPFFPFLSTLASLLHSLCPTWNSKQKVRKSHADLHCCLRELEKAPEYLVPEKHKNATRAATRHTIYNDEFLRLLGTEKKFAEETGCKHLFCSQICECIITLTALLVVIGVVLYLSLFPWQDNNNIYASEVPIFGTPLKFSVTEYIVNNGTNTWITSDIPNVTEISLHQNGSNVTFFRNIRDEFNVTGWDTQIVRRLGTFRKDFGKAGGAGGAGSSPSPSEVSFSNSSVNETVVVSVGGEELCPKTQDRTSRRWDLRSCDKSEIPFKFSGTEPDGRKYLLSDTEPNGPKSLPRPALTEKLFQRYYRCYRKKNTPEKDEIIEDWVLKIARTSSLNAYSGKKGAKAPCWYIWGEETLDPFLNQFPEYWPLFAALVTWLGCIFLLSNIVGCIPANGLTGDLTCRRFCDKTMLGIFGIGVEEVEGDTIHFYILLSILPAVAVGFFFSWFDSPRYGLVCDTEWTNSTPGIFVSFFFLFFFTFPNLSN